MCVVRALVRMEVFAVGVLLFLGYWHGFGLLLRVGGDFVLVLR